MTLKQLIAHLIDLEVEHGDKQVMIEVDAGNARQVPLDDADPPREDDGVVWINLDEAEAA